MKQSTEDRYRKTKKGLTTTIYSSQRQHSKDRGHPLPPYNLEQFREWIYSQPNFEKLYSDWVQSNYDKQTKPSVDRVSNYKPYTLDNIQLVTWKENNLNGNTHKRNGRNIKTNRPVSKYSMTGTRIQTFHSIAEAARSIKTGEQGIYKCLAGTRKSSGGFLWKDI